MKLPIPLLSALGMVALTTPALAQNPWDGLPGAQACTYTPGSREVALELVKATTVNGVMDGVIVRDGRELTRDQAGVTHGTGHDWYDDNQPIQINNKTYVKYGLPRIASPYDLHFVAELDGVFVGAESGGASSDILWVLHNGLECAFQPYRAQ